jgi:hypothetical protein
LTTNILKLSFIEIVTLAKIYVANLFGIVRVRDRISMPSGVSSTATYNAGYFRNVFQIV